MIPTPPTGITVETYNNRVVLTWIKNPELDIQGYNVYNSTTSGGGISGYVRLNNILIEDYSSIDKIVLSTQQQVEQSGNVVTTTTTEQIQEVYKFNYTHSNITEKTTQFYIITAVNNLGEESVSSIEVQATPLTITTSTVTIPVRTQNDISLDYITELINRDPKLDVKPGSVVRQLHVDPNSKEMYLSNVRENFGLRSQSFLMLRQIDDANGDNISDPVSDSTYKQLLGQAFFLTSDLDIQNLIDNAFSALASNYGVNRKAAMQSFTSVTYYTTTAPLTDLTITLNTQVSTIPTETQVAIAFQTLSSGTMIASQISQYYNSLTQRYELVIPVQAVLAGSNGNVGANTIINTNIAGLSVTNPVAATGGSDQESNADLADRAQLAFVGLDVGTAYGYKKTCAAIPGVRDVKVITAGDSLMQRDYDEVRKKHVFGKVDIYIRGGESTQVEDKVGFLYKQSIDEIFTIRDVNNFIIESTNESVNLSSPIYSVNSIRNVSEGHDYDILGDWTVTRNGISLNKRTEVNVDIITGEIFFISPLVTGDVIMASYKYKVPITNEIVISPATGGEVNFSLDHSPIVKRSYMVFKNDIALVETIDYMLEINGAGQLTVGLSPGDVLTANYQYVSTITNEPIISSAIGGEMSANLANGNILESLLIGLDGVSLELDTSNEINSQIGMRVTDRIETTYRYRASDPIVLVVQPASKIISITGSISGPLQADINYSLNKNDDILLEGNSSKAQRSVQIKYANGIPKGDLFDTFETIVLNNNGYKELSNFGVDIESIIVKQGNTTFLINYDYVVLPEGDGLKVRLARSKLSTIPNGTQIQVYYSYGEILDILYEANSLIDVVQQTVDVTRHVTADVLVKDVLETLVDFNISVVLVSGADPVKTANSIITAISEEFDKHKLGQGIAQSDVIRVIEEVPDVISIIVPLNKMAKANGTQINREIIATSFVTYQSSTVTSYRAPQALLYNTLGPTANDGFYAIFENDRPLTLISDPNNVDLAAGQGYIGSNGDIIISTIDNTTPSNNRYTVSYIINGETGANDISIEGLEFISVGTVNVTTSIG